MSKSKSSNNRLFTLLGVIIVLAIIVVVNMIMSSFSGRFDLTEDKLYTLSDGTKTILKELDTPVKINYYVTQDKDAMPLPLRNYAAKVEDLLREYKKRSNGKISVSKFDPEPDSEDEDAANLDGITGVDLGTGDALYMGLSVSCLDKKEVLAFLNPREERLLEYQLSRAVTQVVQPKLPRVGIMTSLPVEGVQVPPQMQMQMQGRGNQPPWYFYTELQRDYRVEKLAPNVAEIDQEIDVLMVIHPSGISPEAEYAIDQYLLGGGKIIALVDPAYVVPGLQQQSPMGGVQLSGDASNMATLLGAWGINFSSQAVADVTYEDKRFRQFLQMQATPTVLQLGAESLSEEDIATNNLQELGMLVAGEFTGEPTEGLTKEVLVKSSLESQDVPPTEDGGKVLADFKASGTQKALAIRLTGKFKTAFPDGKPKAAAEAEPKEGEAAEGKKPALQESETESAVVLIGDADMLNDIAYLSPQNVMGQRFMMSRNSNLAFVQNLVEQLGGDSNLVKVRSRSSTTRPFTRINEMQAEAEAEFRDKILALEEKREVAQNELNRLQAQKDASQKNIISNEQQEQIEKFAKQRAENNKEIKDLRKNLRKDINIMENAVKGINIFLMPLIVLLIGLFVALFRKKLTAAK